MHIPAGMSKPRLCMLKKCSNFAGYGFNLHAEKGKAGHYIGKVDPNSPADTGGLLPNDVVIEVNGANVEESTHQRVVERVKSNPDQVELFVCSIETHSYCKDHGINLNSSMSDMIRCDREVDEPIVAAAASAASAAPTASVQSSTPPAAAAAPAPAAAAAAPAAAAATSVQAVEHERRKENQPPAAARSNNNGNNASNANNANNGSSSAVIGGEDRRQRRVGDDPVGNLSLEQMRAKLGNNKRTQVKMTNTSLSEKYHVFESM